MSETVQQILLATAGTTSLAVLIWMIQTLRDLTKEFGDFKAVMAKLEERLSHLPPPDLLLRISTLEQEVHDLRIKVEDC